MELRRRLTMNLQHGSALMNLIRVVFLGLAVLLPTSWTIAKAADEAPADEAKKTKKTKKAKKADNGDKAEKKTK
jgi:hypothetical protein